MALKFIDINGLTRSVWHNGNMGHNSGLNADLIDGVHLSAITQSGDGYVGGLNDSFWTTASRITSCHVTSNAPGENGWYTIFNNRHRGGTGDGGNLYGSQIAIGMTVAQNEMYFRYQNNGIWGGWNRIWHNNNDGSGSGLDADLLDGKHASAFALLTGATFTGVVSAPSFNATSTIKEKENIKPVTVSAIDILKETEIVFFNFKKDLEKNLKIGFIAENTNSLLSTKNKDSMDIYNAIGLLIKSIQEISTEFTILKNKLQTIENLVSNG